MEQKTFSLVYEEYNNLEELSIAQRALVTNAIDAAENAYAPYSKFKVGAAVKLDNGEIITGNNQENAAYPSGLCAERVALFYAGSKYPENRVISIAIAALNHDGLLNFPVSPCGGCRQVFHETELKQNQPIEIILHGNQKIRIVKSAEDLLPLPFILKK